MNNETSLRRIPTAVAPKAVLPEKAFHPAWNAFIRHCLELGHGEIERLKIQDGLPVVAEVVRKKLKFAP